MKALREQHAKNIEKIKQNIQEELRNAPATRHEEIKRKEEGLLKATKSNFNFFKKLIFTSYRDFIAFNSSKGIDERIFLCRYKVRLVSCDWTIENLFLNADDE